MLAALETSRGKVADSKALWVGTRPDRSDSPFQRLLDGLAGYSQSHAAAKTDKPFWRKTWLKANPSLNHLPALEKAIRLDAKRAKVDPSALASFKALRLNMGVSDTIENTLLSSELWETIEVERAQAAGPYVLGLDLGQSSAMSAAAGYWPENGSLASFAVFPQDPDLDKRGLQDGVGSLYRECFRRGHLIQRGMKISDIAGLLEEVLIRWGPPSVIVTDTWRKSELTQVLIESGFPGCEMILRRQGFFEGGADVREFRNACIDGKVHPEKSLLLRAAMSGARVTTDAAGNSKLAKGGEGRRSRCRDDAAAAAILAIAEGRRRRPAKTVTAHAWGFGDA